MMHSFFKEIIHGRTPGLDMFTEALGEFFPLLERLKQTPQDPKWHGEGNVYIHTAMVLEEVYQLLSQHTVAIDPLRRLSLILSAVFHDIAKSVTTRKYSIDGKERITAPWHADRGRSYLAFKLMELEIPYPVIQDVLSLVGHHHIPKFLVMKDKPSREYQKLARMVDLELLYFLGHANLKGRKCNDLDEQLEHIEMFRMFAKEYGFWKNRDPYKEWREIIETELKGIEEEVLDLIIANAIRDYEAGIIFTPLEAVAKSYQYREAFPRLIVTCGPSGSGKSTWIETHLPDYHLLSLDELRKRIAGNRRDQSKNAQVIQVAKSALKASLRNRKKIVWDATNLMFNHRQAIIRLSMDYHALVSLVVFHLSRGDLFFRNENREYSVPNSVLKRQMDSMEWPYITEAHRVIFVDGQGQYLHFEGEWHNHPIL